MYIYMFFIYTYVYKNTYTWALKGFPYSGFGANPVGGPVAHQVCEGGSQWRVAGALLEELQPRRPVREVCSWEPWSKLIKKVSFLNSTGSLS